MSEAEADSEAVKSPVERLADALIFGPFEAACELVADVDGAAERGRQRVALQLSNARILGQMAVTFGSKELMRRATDLVSQLQRSAPASTPTEEPADAQRPAAPTEPAAGPRPDPVDHVIPGYDDLSASQVVRMLEGLDDAELDELKGYEEAVRGRRTVINRIDQLRSASRPAS